MIKKEISTPLGKMILIVYKGKVVYCNWILADCHLKQTKIERELESGVSNEEDLEIAEETVKQLYEYFSGLREDFNLPIYMMGSEFRKKVWKQLLSIPYGEVATYNEIAFKTGCRLGYRAVAQACGANPIAIIIPCHRVVGKDRNPGGYTGGIDKKVGLLNLECRKSLEKICSKDKIS